MEKEEDTSNQPVPPPYERNDPAPWPTGVGAPGLPTVQPTPWSTGAPGQTTVMAQPVTSTVIVTGAIYGPYPMQMQCPACHAHIQTMVEYHSGGMSWLICFILCLFGCWLGCCLIPFCVDSLKNATHFCPNCKAIVGKYDRL